MARNKKKSNKSKPIASQDNEKESEKGILDEETIQSTNENSEEVLDAGVKIDNAEDEKNPEQLIADGIESSSMITTNQEDKERVEETTCIDENNTEALKEKLDRMQEERDKFESQYNMLLSKLSSMKTIFSKMKEAQQELEDTKEQLSEYENRNMTLTQKLESSQKEVVSHQSTISTLNEEVLNLNKECEALSDACSEYRSEITSLQSTVTKVSSEKMHVESRMQAELIQLQEKLQNFEVVLNHEKQDRRDLEEQLEDCKIQLNQEKEAKKQLDALIKSLDSAIKESEKTLSDKTREHVDEVSTLRKEVHALSISNEEKDEKLLNLTKVIESMKIDIEAKEKFENEAKERALQIGKLRHEAIILNEHLTKALTMLKHSNNSENVDKELISNLFISFVTIPRGDPKKFEVLELISSFLNWDSDKKSQAGLIQNSNALKTGSRTQNFVSLWTEFLEKESEK